LDESSVAGQPEQSLTMDRSALVFSILPGWPSISKVIRAKREYLSKRHAKSVRASRSWQANSARSFDVFLEPRRFDAAGLRLQQDGAVSKYSPRRRPSTSPRNPPWISDSGPSGELTPCGNALACEGCGLKPACALALPRDHPAVVSARATLSPRRRHSDAGAYSAYGKGP
jgi:hypothetical protein